MRIIDRRESLDGSVKYLHPVGDRMAVESVVFLLEGVPHICVSTQVGCNVGCPFCETGKTNNQHNLTSDEVEAQVTAALADLDSFTHFHDVTMAGMGEPLLNFDAVTESASHMKLRGLTDMVTVTTAGIAPAIRRLAATAVDQLTISLHATTNELRDRLVPTNRKYPLETVIEAATHFRRAKPLPIIVNYLLFDSMNDTDGDLERLKRLIDPERFVLHLKVWNAVDDVMFKASLRFDHFAKELERDGFHVKVSRSSATDIAGGCGQLRARAARSISLLPG